MHSFRDSLPGDFLRRMHKELGREETLRLLWPAIVGPQLGRSTRLKAIRHSTLLVSVPDRTWKTSLASLEGMILEAVHRFCGEEIGQAIEFVEDLRLASPSQNAPSQRTEPARSLAAADLPVEAITDPELRELFLRSASKYFARQEVHPT